MRSVRVVGVHPIEADEPCHLIELAVCDPGREFNVDDLTQVDETIRKGLWQVAYDERFLDTQSLQPLAAATPRWRALFLRRGSNVASLAPDDETRSDVGGHGVTPGPSLCPFSCEAHHNTNRRHAGRRTISQHLRGSQRRRGPARHPYRL